MRPVLDDSVRHLYIPRQEIDRYQRLARGEAGSGVESFLSASFELTIVSGVRAQLFAYRLSSTLGSPPVFVVYEKAQCCFVLLIPTPEEYRVPRVNPGVTASSHKSADGL